MSQTILDVSKIAKAYGGNQVVSGVDLSVTHNEIVALVGPNGAGKTTTLNLLSGQISLDSGSIHLAGIDVSRLGPSRPERHALFRSFQNGGTFAKLTAVQNVAIAGVVRGMSLFDANQAAVEALDRVGMTPVAYWQANKLSGGQRKLIDFARLLVANPRVALLDEPTAGVSPSIMEVMGELVQSMRRLNTAFVIISHDLPWVFGLCDRVVVLATGKVMCAGSPEEVRANKDVQEAYLA
ncbi:MAG: ATP-binding cassette domain-containing protein [Candidimonas sp.]|nr:MAG: ATP-binding cassette domain-containing protein [Candidimonas sp.]TAM24150.1 MAG: ATP-binding cassette domain-containing protein [Candidimonas sp.]TAM76880.1 MAG: ATP-binding cassette domain-containing protein [Candidimonas sp.]